MSRNLRIQASLKFAMQSKLQTPFFFNYNESWPQQDCHAYSKIECRKLNCLIGIRVVFLNPDELTVVKSFLSLKTASVAILQN